MLLLLHVPPASPFELKVDVAPTHNELVPDMVPALAARFTVTESVVEAGLPQPLLTVYVISVVPAATAVTSPVEASTVATAVLLLLHVPPAVPFVVKVDVAPVQSGVVPVIVPALTFGSTVMEMNVETGLPQPLLTVYVISAVPAATPVTSPVEASTVAIAVLLLLHVPPAVPLLVNVTGLPIQSGVVPVMVPADTFGLTVKVMKDELPEIV